MHNIIARNINFLIKKNGITRTELAEATDIPQPTISRIISGTSNNPRKSTLEKIALYFQIALDKLQLEELSEQNQKISKIPIIDVGAIQEWLSDNTTTENNTSPMLIVTGEFSRQSFAIEYDENLPLSYIKHKRILMVFDPLIKPKNGDIVLVKLEKINKTILREVIIDIDVSYIKSLNPELVIPGQLNKLKEHDAIIATLVQTIIESK